MSLSVFLYQCKTRVCKLRQLFISLHWLIPCCRKKKEKKMQPSHVLVWPTEKVGSTSETSGKVSLWSPATSIHLQITPNNSIKYICTLWWESASMQRWLIELWIKYLKFNFNLIVCKCKISRPEKVMEIYIVNINVQDMWNSKVLLYNFCSHKWQKESWKNYGNSLFKVWEPWGFSWALTLHKESATDCPHNSA